MSARETARPPARRPAPRAAVARIERATDADLPALAELEQTAFADDRISARSWRALLSSRSSTVTVARAASGPEPGDALLGATVVLRRARSSVARLYLIAVAPKARGSGVASQLLDDATQRSREEGCAVLRLETRTDNHAAQRLFQRHGFTPLDRKRGLCRNKEFRQVRDATCSGPIPKTRYL